MASSLSLWEESLLSAGLAKASQAPPADEAGAVYAALSAGALECRLSAFRPESCQKPVWQCSALAMSALQEPQMLLTESRVMKRGTARACIDPLSWQPEGSAGRGTCRAPAYGPRSQSALRRPCWVHLGCRGQLTGEQGDVEVLQLALYQVHEHVLPGAQHPGLLCVGLHRAQH